MHERGVRPGDAAAELLGCDGDFGQKELERLSREADADGEGEKNAPPRTSLLARQSRCGAGGEEEDLPPKATDLLRNNRREMGGAEEPRRRPAQELLEQKS